MSKKKTTAVRTMSVPKPQPWDQHMRALKKKAIDNEAIGVAKRLGGLCCIVIMFFKDGDMIHILDGGQSPIPTPQLYATMMVNSQKMAQGEPEGWVS